MKVLYIAAECKPFSKVGGQADVAGELPPALQEIGVDIEIVTPLYDSVDRKSVVASDRIAPYYFDYNWRTEEVRVHQSSIGKVPVWLLENSAYFGGWYGRPFINSAYIPFEDDIKRFAFFSRACLRIIDEVQPDIVHINDWCLSYLFGWLKIRGYPQRRVITIHNIGYQGNIYRPQIMHTPVEEFANHEATRDYFWDPRPERNSVNALRLGLELCDMANTVSRTYAEEITQPEDGSRYFEGGKGLNAVTGHLRNTGRLVGIVNGFQYKSDFSEASFRDTLERKRAAKAALGAYFHSSQSILFGFVGRAVEQKFRLLGEWLDGRSILEHILNIPGVNVAILATGQPEYEAFIGNLSLERFGELRPYDHVLFSGRRGNYACTVAFDRVLGERISLGSDVFLMPSLFEPCGITQLESMSNATPPLVRRTGGLADTVIPHDQPNGTGFVFDGSTPRDLLNALLNSVRTACDVYRNPDWFGHLQYRAAQMRFLWSDAAGEYRDKIYAPLMEPGR